MSSLAKKNEIIKKSWLPRVAFSIVISLTPVAGECRVILEEGTGALGIAYLGKKPLQDTNSMGSKVWTPSKNKGIKLKLGNDGRVKEIQCDSNCITSGNIGIGSSVKRILLRHGAPSREWKNDNGDESYQYDGITFVIKDRKVKSILIHSDSTGR